MHKGELLLVLLLLCELIQLLLLYDQLVMLLLCVV